MAKKQKLPYECIVFVCTNKRDEDERVSCAGHGREGGEIRDELKDAVKKAGLKGRVRVCASGCMDKCEEGANAMVFKPGAEPKWFSRLTKDDIPKLLDEITTD